MYYFVNWRETPDGKEADLPEEVDYVMLAEPSSVADYALFECAIPDEYEDWETAEPVSDQLYDLIESAKDYPPALALARREVNDGQVIPKSEFARQLIERLEFYLRYQRAKPYFMARKINRRTQWHSEGGFYWIIGFDLRNAIGEVSWVSHDYYICHASLEDFEIDKVELEERFGK